MRRSVGFTGIFRVVSGWFWEAPLRVVSTRVVATAFFFYL